MSAAAVLRACGANWAQVAAQLGRARGTCQNWPGRYPADWEAMFTSAERTFVRELTAECRSTLRKHLRAKELRDQREGAKIMLAHLDRNRPRDAAPSPETIEILLGGLPDEAARELGSAADGALRKALPA
jgi:hypothetical protein